MKNIYSDMGTEIDLSFLDQLLDSVFRIILLRIHPGKAEIGSTLGKKLGYSFSCVLSFHLCGTVSQIP